MIIMRINESIYYEAIFYHFYLYKTFRKAW